MKEERRTNKLKRNIIYISDSKNIVLQTIIKQKMSDGSWSVDQMVQQSDIPGGSIDLLWSIGRVIISDLSSIDKNSVSSIIRALRWEINKQKKLEKENKK